MCYTDYRWKFSTRRNWTTTWTARYCVNPCTSFHRTMARRRAKGEGSVFQRTNGTWVAYVTVNGRRRSHTAKTKQEAAKKLAALKVARIKRKDVPTVSA